MLRRVRLDRGRGAGPTAAALIEQHDAVMIGIEEAAHEGAASAAGTTVQNDDGSAGGIAVLLDIQSMPVAHV